jgi:hypothetical protein
MAIFYNESVAIAVKPLSIYDKNPIDKLVCSLKSLSIIFLLFLYSFTFLPMSMFTKIPP